ncbi:MAG: flavin reductase family protein [Eubacteriales bacterium]|nr:flavin reductase family protein [Eubacteriales bacterium]
MELQEIFRFVPQAAEQLTHGAFLTAGGPVWNPMTIGWAQFGVVWGKPVVTVMVRRSRFTFRLMENAAVFSVSVPRSGELNQELGFCGSRSGKNVNKELESGLKRAAARSGGADGVMQCGVIFECRILQKQLLDLDTLDAGLRARYYGANQALADGDPHMLYVGEVLAAYEC